MYLISFSINLLTILFLLYTFIIKLFISDTSVNVGCPTVHIFAFMDVVILVSNKCYVQVRQSWGGPVGADEKSGNF